MSSLGSCPPTWWLKATRGFRVQFSALPGAGPNTHHPFQEKALCLVLESPKGKMLHSLLLTQFNFTLYYFPFCWEYSHYSTCLFLSAAISRVPVSLSTLFETVFKVGTDRGEKPLPPTEVLLQFFGLATNQHSDKFTFIHGFAQKGLHGLVFPQPVEDFWSKTTSLTALLQELTCQLLNHL